MRTARTAHRIKLWKEGAGADSRKHLVRLVLPALELRGFQIDGLHNFVGEMKRLDDKAFAEICRSGEKIKRVFEAVVFFLRAIAGTHTAQHHGSISEFGDLI